MNMTQEQLVAALNSVQRYSRDWTDLVEDYQHGSWVRLEDVAHVLGLTCEHADYGQLQVGS